MYSFVWLRALVRQRLSPKRAEHSLCVERRSAQLAAIHGADWYKAAAAGLLHDIFHCEPFDAQLKYLEARGILLDDFYRQHPPLWHAICGSVYLREELGITDVQILNAVRYHTTGRGGMTLLEKVVFIADTTSDDREFPGATELRDLADRNLDAAVGTSLLHTVRMLAGEGSPIVQDAWEAYNQYAGLAEWDQ